MHTRRHFDTGIDAGRNDVPLKRAEPGRPERPRFRSLVTRSLTAVLLAVFAALLAIPAQAQTPTTLVSNSGQTHNTALSYIVGVDLTNQWSHAQQFTTGDNANGYTLSSVQLYLSGFTGTAEARVSIYEADASGDPTSSKYTLTNPGTITNNSLNTFTAPPGAILAAETKYLVVVEAPTGTYSIGYTSSTAEDSGNASGWSINNQRHRRSSDSGSWSTSTDVLRISVSGTLNTTAVVPYDWGLKPSGLDSGDEFRLIFLSSTKRNGSSSDISTYNTFVQGRAAVGHADIQDYSDGFRVVGCTEDDDARDNTETTYTSADRGLPIYWLNGDKVADNYHDFYNGNWDEERHNHNRNERGTNGPNTGQSANYPLTGCDHDGTVSFTSDNESRALGSTNGFVRVGRPDQTGGPLSSTLSTGTDANHPMYGLSQIFRVGISNDATLSALTVNDGTTDLTLEPAFTSDTYVYATDVGNDITTVTLTATLNQDDAEIGVTLGGTAIADTVFSDGISVPSLAIGRNEIVVTVTAEDTTTQTYTVTVTRDLPPPTLVPEDWSLKPTALSDRDKFRLIFLSSTKRNAVSTDIADYNTFVRGRAAVGHADIQDYSAGFTAVGCTTAVDARDNTETTYTTDDKGVPIYWLNGNKVADEYEDFYDGNWDDEANNKNESGENGLATSLSANYPITGCDDDGTEEFVSDDSRALGESTVRVGRPNSTVTGNGPIGSRSTTDPTDTRPMYGLSQVFQVPFVASTDATLSALTVNDGTNDLPLDPAFTSTTYAYAADVENAVTTVTLTATVNDDGAAVSGVTLAGTAIADTDFTDGITVPSLFIGDNAVVVTVTAEDTTTTQTYTVTVTRDLPPPTDVAANWSLKPTGLSAGDKFRLIFLSSTKRNASPTDISTYNTFVQDRAAAGHTDIQAYSAGFRVVGCTAAADARDNTETTYTTSNKGVPIYWLNGAKAADDYEDFYDGDWDDEANDKNESGTDGPDTSHSDNWPFTGCDDDGTKAFDGSASRVLGSTGGFARMGKPNDSGAGNGPLSSSTGHITSSQRPLYGLSEVFRVAQSTDATLSDLTVNDGINNLILDPAFASGTYAYAADVETAVTTVTLTATVNDDGAVITGVTRGGTAIADIDFSDGISVPSLVVGDNVIVVTVTAEDTTTQTYTVTVTRALPPPTLVPADWSLKPTGLSGGDKFRLIFLSSTKRKSGASNIADYNTFVQDRAAAGHTDIQAYSDGFRVVGCTAAADARDNTYTTYTTSNKGVPIYWLNGAKAADDYEDFYDGDWDDEANDKNESGTDGPDTSQSGNYPWTGCADDGTEAFNASNASRALGRNTSVRHARPNSTVAGNGPISSTASTNRTSNRPMYGLSEVFEIAAGSTDATLSALTVNDGTNNLTLVPVFTSGTYAYAADVENAVTTVTLTATPNHSGAEVSGVTLRGTAIADTDFTDGITVPSLVVGDNVIVVTVTAENTVSTQTYTVTVTRGAVLIPANWSLKPASLTSGDKFRLIFLSSTRRNATSSDISTYNTFVQTRAAAGHTDIQDYSDGFTVVGCTTAVDARDNTYTTFTTDDRGVPIYWLDGNKVADNYQDFYNGNWDNEANDKNESGTNGPDTSVVTNYPITGCDHDGTEEFASDDSRALGESSVRVGRPNSSNTGNGPIGSVSVTSSTSNRPMYGLSQVFRVGASTDDATLSALTVNDGTNNLTLDPAFASGTYAYAAEVTGAVEEVTLTATPNHSGAVVSDVTLASTAVADTDFSDGIMVPSLVVGDNVIVVTVTAEDTTTTQTYTVTVTRGLPPPTEVPADWSLKPTGLGATDKFRLIFLSSTSRNASTGQISTYNTFIQNRAAAGHADIQAYSDGFKVVGCTAAVDARDNTETTYTSSDKGVPIYWLNGNKVADEYEDFYDGDWDDETNDKNESGNNGPDTSNINNYPFTGCNDDGTEERVGGDSYGLGSSVSVRLGRPNSTSPGDGPISSSSSAVSSITRPFYGLSEVFQVVESTDATLSALTVNDGTNNLPLDPAFTSDTYAYAAEVTAAVEEVTLTATPNDDGAEVTGVTLGGTAIADTGFTDGISVPSLAIGRNVIVVTVTAEDNTSTQTYTVTVTRDLPPPTEVLADWSLKPSGLSGGDKFRLIFLSSTKRNATSSDIADYNTFVQNRAAAGHTDIQAYSDGFTVVGCTTAVDARDNTYTTYTTSNKGVPIYWLNGAKAADDYEDFYDGDWDDEANDKNESGTNGPNTSQSGNYPFTGCDDDGTEEFVSGDSRALGESSVRVGRPNESAVGNGPIGSITSIDSTNTRPFYGLSEVFQVVESTDATLSALTVNDGTNNLTLDPAFTSDTYAYEADVVTTVTTVTLTATPNHSGAGVTDVTLRETAIADSDFTDGISVPSLAIGRNVIVVTVTAEDNTSTQTYTVTVTRAVPPATLIPANWSLIPTGLGVGDKFRLIFLSSTKRNAAASSISTYNNFVKDRAAAGHADIQAYSDGFRVVGCTTAVDARDNTYTTYTTDDMGVPIYWLNGNKVADDYEDFYDGDWDDEANDKNESGTDGPDTSQSGNYPWTGCADDGTEAFNASNVSRALGQNTSVRHARPNSTVAGNGPISSTASTNRTSNHPMYGLSEVFEVAAGSTDATLSALTVNDGTNELTLDPAFTSGTYAYAADVENAVTTVTLTATPNHGSAEVSGVTLRGTAIADTNFTDGITVPSLFVGDNVIVVTVTAENTVSTQTYTITVTRGAVLIPANWSLKPASLTSGDKFRLLFLSSTRRNATSSDISTYNTFVQTRAAAGHTDIQAYSDGVRVVGCTTAVDARDNTYTTFTTDDKGVPIYWLNGNKAADEYQDFYDGNWDDEANDKNESGTNGPDTSQSGNYPWTGCKHNGTEEFASGDSRALGESSARVGRPNSSDSDTGPLGSQTHYGKSANKPMYGLSEVFEVKQSTRPGTSSDLKASGRPEIIDLSWAAPTSDGGADITGYKIEVSVDAGSTWTTLVASTGDANTSYSHTGLPAGATRHYRVSAINSVGTGDASNEANATSQSTTSVPGNWSLKPTGLTTGDKFRLLFLSSTSRNGTSNDIADYNTFAQDRAAAGHADIQDYSAGFTAVGCTTAVDARDNTRTTYTSTDKGLPIYWLNGTKVADDYQDFYNGDWDDEVNDKDESGANGLDTSLSTNYPFTGCNHNGTEKIVSGNSRALGTSLVRVGRPNSSDPNNGPISSGSGTSKNNSRPFYGLSAVFEVDDASADATLSALTVNDGMNELTLDPAFISSTYAYAADVGNAVTTVTLTATVNYDGATVSGVTLGGTAIADTDFSDGITVPSLVVGDNVIVVTVTAEDTTTTQTYTVTVTRGLPPSTEVPADWSLKPTGLTSGDKFRLLFLSSTKRKSRASNIADYNTFVQDRAAAGHTDIQAYSDGFRVVGCTAAADARDNTYTTYTTSNKGVPIYWLNGAKAADDYEDFYDGDWDDEVNDKNESGTDGPNTSQSGNYPWTGCADDGTEAFVGGDSRALGESSVRVGRPNSTTALHGPIGSTNAPDSTSNRPMYGLSEVFRVGLSTDATLSDLTVNDGTNNLTLDPAFTSGTYAYAADVENAVTTVTLTATVNDDGAAVSGVTLGGTAIIDSAFSDGITVPSLVVGENEIVVTVTAEDTTTQTYTITVTRAAPPVTDALVSNLVQTHSPTSGYTAGISGANKYTQTQQFTTGDNTAGYTLSSVQLYITNFSGTDEARISIYEADSSGNPSASRYTLTNPGTITNESLNTFTAPANSTLDAETKYFVVAEAPTGSYAIGYTSSNAEDSGKANNWSINNQRHLRSSDSGSWTTSTDKLRIRVRGTLNSTEVPANWGLKPTGLTSGDKFRLLFLSSTSRNANSSNISTYNTFVQTRAAAGHADIQAYSAGFKVVGCTAAADARDNTSTTYTTTDKGVPIYWLNGNRAADDYEDFYDGDWDDEANDKNESGTDGPDTSQTANYPFTGCDHDGTEAFNALNDSRALGATGFVRLGRPNSSGAEHGPIGSGSDNSPTNTRPFYGLSEVFQVADASTDATLSALTVNDGTNDLTLDPAFISSTYAYAADVGNAVTTVTLTATVNDDGAAVSGVTLGGTAIADSEFSDGIMVPSLAVGHNVIVVTVTAEDTTMQTYTVTVTRAAPPITDALVSNTGQTHNIASGYSVGTFGGNKYTYTQQFTTGDNTAGYNLSSVQLYLSSFIGTDEARVSIYEADASGDPSTSRYTLTNPGTITNESLNTFTAPANSTLDAETKYFVVAEAPTGFYTIGYTSSTAEDSGKANGWSINNQFHSRSSDSGSWSTSSNVLRISVRGTLDTNPPGVSVSKTTLTITEEDSNGDSYTVVLDSEPTASVTVTVAGHSGTDVTPSPVTLTFATTNWETPQTVTVTAANDSDTTNDSVTLTHSASSTDTDYSGITIASLSVTVNDNDTANTAPQFSSPTADRNVAENTAAGQNVGGVLTATDDDMDTLSYSLEGTDAASFAIVSNTGQIRTKSGVSYDHEAKSTYSVTVKADDDNGGTDTIAVTITVTDVNEPPSAPAAPMVSPTAGSTTSLDINWTAPSNTGPPITNYGVRYRQGTSGPWTNGPQNVTVTSAVITSLVADTSYQVQVRATNPEGDGGWSTSGTGTTNSPSNAAPTFNDGNSTSRIFNETIGDAAVASASNIGTPVAATDTNSGDTLTYSLEGTDAAKFGIIATSGQIRTKVGEKYNYEADTSYSVTVKVEDGNGASDTIAVTLNVTDQNEPPLAPTITSVTATSGSATSLDVSWTPPVNTGRPDITNYDLRYRQGLSGSWINGPQNVTITGAVITSLVANTSYQVQVRATNPEGNGGWSSSVSGTTGAPPDTVPGAPTGLEATASGQTQINLSWNGPANDGGSPVTGYRIEVSPNGSSNWSDHVADTGSADTTYSHTGLPASTTRHYRVSAINSVGTGPASNVASATTGQVTVTFGASSYTATEGGAAATVAVDLSEAPPATVTIPLTTAVLGGATTADYSGVPASVTFTTAQTRRTFTVTATDDTDDDDDESVRIGFGTLPNGFEQGSRPTATVELVDNDTTLPIVTIRPASTTEGEDIVFTVGISRPIPGFRLLFFGTGTRSIPPGSRAAIKGEDYRAPHPSVSAIQIGYGRTSAEIRLSTIDDDLVEGTEVFGIALYQDDDTYLGTPHTVVGTIRDDENNGQPYRDTVRGDTSTSATISAGGSVTGRIEEVDDADWYRTSLTRDHCYRVRAEGGNDDSGLTLHLPALYGVYRSNGSYVPGTYNNSDGQGSAAVINVKLDTTATYYISVGLHRFEGAGTYRLSLSDLGTSVTDCGAAKSGSLDPPPALQLSVADAGRREWPDPQAYLIFDVTLDRRADREVRVNYATEDGTAVAGLDYRATSGTLVFSEGESSKRIWVPIEFDDDDEVTETMTLRLSNAIGAQIYRGVATGSIVDHSYSR